MVPGGFTPSGFVFEKSSCWIHSVGFSSTVKISCWIHSFRLSSWVDDSPWIHPLGFPFWVQKFLLDSLLGLFVFGQGFLLDSLLPSRFFVFSKGFCWSHCFGFSSSANVFCWIHSLGFFWERFWLDSLNHLSQYETEHTCMNAVAMSVTATRR